MRLGIISDTHGAIENTQRAVRMLESLDVDHLLHCGDIGTPEIVELLAPWPTEFVFGNCDYDKAPLRKAMKATAHHTCHEEFADLRLANVSIALLHSHDKRRFDMLKQNNKHRLVCYGHTHLAAMERIDETLVLNPGAIYRANPHSIAIVELPRIEATIVEI